MMNHKKLFAAVILIGLVGVSRTGFAATAELIVQLQNGTITLPDAIAMWSGSFAEYAVCESTGGANCFKALIDPDGVVGGEFEVEFDTGTVFGSNEEGSFFALQESALVPVEFFNNSFVGSAPTLTTNANGTTSISRTIAFDANVPFAADGPRTIANYELFDGAIAENLVGFSPASFVQAAALDIFDEVTELVISFTPQRVSTDFNVRLANVVGEDITSHTEAIAIADGSQPAQFSVDVVRNFSSVNFGGGTFEGDEAFPDGGPNDDSREQYIMEAHAQIDIPAGEWAIAFGSDDGGQLTLGNGNGIDFEETYGEDNPPGNPGQIFFDGERPHGWTAGRFSTTAPLTDVDFFASMHERTGTDSFEIAICDLSSDDCVDDDISNVVSPDNGWVILRDGALNWGVGTEFEVGPASAMDDLFRKVEIPTTNTVPEPSSGLLVFFGILGISQFRRRALIAAGNHRPRNRPSGV